MLDEAKEDPDLAIVVQLFEITGLAPLFSCPGPFTALFPVNGTLAALSPMLSYRCCRCLYFIGRGTGSRMVGIGRSGRVASAVAVSCIDRQNGLY